MNAAVAGVERGLVATLSDTPVRGAYAQLVGGDYSLSGPFILGELGARLTQQLSLYGQAGFERETGWGAALGLRWEFL